MSRKLLAAVLALVLTGWLLQGCGTSGGKMTPAAASTLQRDVAAVVSAADGSRWDAAIDALDQLETDLASAQATGGLSDERAAQIRAVRQRVLEDLQRIRLSSTTPGTATSTQTTPSTESSDDGGDDGQSSKSKDRGNGDHGGGKHHGKNKDRKG